MIELNTGTPGSGKTLSMVERLAKAIKRWEKHPEEARAIFVLGIPDLKLPHALVPLKSVQLNKNASPQLVPDWDAMPDGSLVIIDEAQGCFPPRSSIVTAPEHVAWLNTHRHRGFDIWLTTQHPKLIDVSVRALVGKHMHFRRLFGRKKAIIYEWDSCSDSLGGMKTAVKTFWSYPKKVFDWYKSAEVHTKQSFKLPIWLLLPFIAAGLALFFIPQAFGTLKGGIEGKQLGDGKKTPSASAKSAQGAQAGGAPLGAQASASATAEKKPDDDVIAGCMSMGKKCVCISSAGKMTENPTKCHESSREMGHLVHFKLSPVSESKSAVPAVPAPSRAASVPPVSTGGTMSFIDSPERPVNNSHINR